jgi:hypothetical protein
MSETFSDESGRSGELQFGTAIRASGIRPFGNANTDQYLASLVLATPAHGMPLPDSCATTRPILFDHLVGKRAEAERS